MVSPPYYTFDTRLFPIEMDSEIRTKLRDLLLRAFGEAADKSKCLVRHKMDEKIRVHLEASGEEYDGERYNVVTGLLNELCDQQAVKGKGKKKAERTTVLND